IWTLPELAEPTDRPPPRLGVAIVRFMDEKVDEWADVVGRAEIVRDTRDELARARSSGRLERLEAADGHGSRLAPEPPQRLERGASDAVISAFEALEQAVNIGSSGPVAARSHVCAQAVVIERRSTHGG